MKTLKPEGGWRREVHTIIYGTDTRAGRLFDVALIAAIALSTVAVILESMAGIRAVYGEIIKYIEWFFTILFTAEYIFRIIVVSRPAKYVFSFYGLIDIFAILPTYIGLLIPGTHYLMALRALRILRVFRVMKLVLYLKEGELILSALKSSRRKITVFLSWVMLLVFIMGSLMYLIEGEANGFTSIPRGIYWAVVTLTTVGYGDISPKTDLGQFLAAIVMVMGYAIIAVPTGIVTVEMAGLAGRNQQGGKCANCGKEGHDRDAVYCKWCGGELKAELRIKN